MGPLIFPGEGNLTQVLSKIRRIGADMHEFEHTCQCLHARLKRISQALDVNDQNLPGDSRNRYVAVVTKYLHYLKHHRGKKMVYRVVEHRIMTDELSRISEEVAKIFALLGLSTSTASWSDFWRDEILALEDVLDTTVGDKKIVTREFQDRRDREEAMLTLKFEIDRRKERHDDFILTLMGKLMATIMSVFDSRVEGLPPWFIPSNEVSYQSRAFARGSCSTVHHGEWGLGTNVVVKCFLVDNVAMDESVQLKIIYEINIWHRLNHPNVIKVYGASTVSSPPFIVCEDAINGHLGSFLAQSGENKRRMWPLLHQAALGLDYIHKQGVVHGDLKLSNILVGADGQAKVSAFRSSAIRTCSPRAKTNSSGIASGGLRWRAPESLRKGPNFALDVYSLALCIIEAVIGEPLLAFRRDDSIRENLQQGELPERPDEMSDEVWELVISMTSKDPDNRLSLHHVIERMKSYAERAMTVCGDTECAVGTTGDAVVRAESQTRRSMIDSSIPDLIAGVQADNAEEQDETLLRLVQACVNDDQRHHNINANTVSVLADIVKNSPTFFGRVCALECLHWSADTDSTFPLDEFETLRDCVRDVMPDECTTLVNTLRINNEQQKLRAVVYCACIAELPSRHRLRNAGVVSPLNELLINRSEIVRLWSAHALGNLVDSAVVADEIASRGSIEPLVELLRCGNNPQKGLAAYALGCLAMSEKNADKIAKLGAISPLVGLLQCEADSQKGFAAFALERLSNDAATQNEILNCGAIPHLVKIMCSGTTTQQEHAVRAIACLADNNQGKCEMMTCHIIEPLISLLRTGLDVHKEHAVYALGSLADNHTIRQEIRTEGGITPLVNLLDTGTAVQKEYASCALCRLADGNASRKAIARHGAIKALVKLLLTGTEMQKEYALYALISLAKLDVNCTTIGKTDTISHLVKLLQIGTESLKKWAINALVAFGAQNEACRKAMDESGAVTQLAKVFVTKTGVHQERAMRVLGNFAKFDSTCVPTSGEYEVISPSMELLQSGTADQKEYAAYMLSNLARRNGVNQKLIVERGGVAELHKLLESGTESQKELAAIALDSLLGDSVNEPIPKKRKRYNVYVEAP